MDPATVIGLLLAFGSLIVMVLLEGGSLSSLLLPAPMILVFGATLAIGLAGNTLKDVVQAFKAVPGMFIGKTAKPQDSIDQMVRFAEKARSEGLLLVPADENYALYDVAADGRFLFSRRVPEQEDGAMIVMAEHWFSELREKLRR